MRLSKIRSFFVAALLLLVGCAQHLQFQVVDALTHHPLPGVEVSIKEGSSFEYFHRRPNVRDVGVTDTNGVISLSSVGSKDAVYFAAPGHRGACAGLAGHGKVVIVPNPPKDVDRMSEERSVVDSDGVVTVPLTPDY